MCKYCRTAFYPSAKADGNGYGNGKAMDFWDGSSCVSIAVGFSQRIGNGTSLRGALVPDKPKQANILGLKPP